MLSTQHRFLFVHIPKTAGNAVQNILRHYSDDEIVCNEHQDGVERFGVRSARFDTRKHSTLAIYRREFGEELFGSLYKFTCVRDPWQRAISFYFSPHRGKTAWDRQDFIEFLGTIKPVAAFLSASETGVQPLAEAVRNVDFLMRFESLEADFRTVCERIGVPAQPLPVRNRSRREDYRSYYDDETRALVGTLFHEEIELFGYAFD